MGPPCRYRHIVPDGTLVSVSLITRYDDDRGVPVSHWHTLEAKEGGPVSKPLTLGSARFPNLVVTRSSAGPAGGGAAAADADSRNPEVCCLLFCCCCCLLLFVAFLLLVASVLLLLSLLLLLVV